jgi:putative peptidoglycan lipid II flippase
LVGRHGVLGLGLAFGLAYVISSIVALVVIERRYPEFASLALLRSLAPMLASALCAGGAAWALGRAVGSTSGVGALVRTALSFGGGSVVYLLLLRALGVPETARLVERLRGVSAER